MTSDELAQIRDWVGDTVPTDIEVEAVYVVQLTAAKTAQSILKRRRGNLLQDPLSWSGPDYNEAWSATLDGIEKILNEVGAAVYLEDNAADQANPGAPIIQPVNIGRSDRDRLFG